MTPTPARTTQRSRTPLIIAALLAAAAGAGFWYFERQDPASATPPSLTTDARQYVRHLKLSGVEIKRTESYLQSAVVEIVGNITNTGERPLRQVELNCVFYDPYGQLVLRQRIPIVREMTGGLKPGETRSFRLPFDSIPASWNQSMPQLVIAGINFG